MAAIPKFTNSAQEAVQQGQSEAIRRSHQELQPEHILFGCISDTGDSAVVPNLLQVTGVSVPAIRERIEQALNRLPKVSGPGELYASGALNRLFVMAHEEAKDIGDEYE